jgi:ribose 5-phosphate isomerase A
VPSLDAAKRDAAERALEHVRSGMTLGLGTGSTAAIVVEGLGKRLVDGRLRDIVGVPTSRRTRDLAEAVGIRLTTLEDLGSVDLTIDGADEVDPEGNLIKGHGGALLWEKIVAAHSRKYVIVVDESKMVRRLGERFAVPVEVVPFGWRTHVDATRALGGEATLRTDSSEPYRTDSGHYILDCRFAGGIADPRTLERELRARPGVVETGLFLDMHPVVIVGRSGA